MTEMWQEDDILMTVDEVHQCPHILAIDPN
jgi:hypothetical protein